MGQIRCRSCNAPIIFVPTAAANDRGDERTTMPLDATPEKRAVIVDGMARIVDTWTPHWSTCPHAAQHRRPRPRSSRPAATGEGRS